MNWNRLSLFKLPNRHKRFEYVPRYYDPKKEALKDKINRAKQEATIDDNGKFARDIKFRADTAARWGNSEYKSQSMRSNIRLIIILMLVIVTFYYLFIGLDIAGMGIDENLDKLK
ncbi:hypothetical protein N8987_00440 [Crocinitomix sp.]|nr:hypothetical protein [Crocinitomix sp.]